MGIFTKRRYLENFDINDGEIRLEIDRSAARQFAFVIRRMADDANVGYCDLRLGHSISLYYYGNIGYHVYPEYRGNNYAYKACLLLFRLAREMGMDYLLITASPDNLASVRTCEKLEGTFLECADVPIWHPLFRNQEYLKNIYRYELRR